MGWRRRRKPENCWCINCSSRSRISCWKFTTPIIRSAPRSITKSRRRRRRSAPKNSGSRACRNISAISRSLLDANGGAYVTGRRLTYVDLSLFQIVEGLRYAFPRRMKAFEQEIPGLVDLHDRVAARPNIKAYLASDRRIAFNEDGIFRRYKALDV